MISSAILFYGPGAKQKAHDFALLKGRLLAPPFGESGLKTEEAREIVALLTSAPIGDRLGIVIIGPMDDANPKSSDVLLKSVEEFNGKQVCPVLWARDLGGVPPTIHSRCLAEWCHGEDEDEDAREEEGRKLIHAWQSRDIPTLIDVVKGWKPDEVMDMVSSICLRISGKERYADLWAALKKVLVYPDVLPSEILVALLKSMKIRRK